MLKNYLRTFKEGFKGYSRAIVFISKNKLSYFYLFPLLLNLILFVLGIKIVDYFNYQINDYVSALIFSESANTSFWYGFLNSVIYWTVWVVSKIVFVYVFALIGGYFTIIILSPIFTFLSEKTAEIITGEKINFHLKQLVKDIFRAIIIALRNMIIQLFFSILFLLASLIPIIGWIIGLMGNFLLSSYFYGFAFVDYSNERNKLSLKESVEFVRKNKGFASGVGSVFALCFFIPIIGGTLASFLAIVCVVNATIGVEEIRKKTKLIA
jgi:CysZ protein